jgi:hypothetical protein
VTWLTPGLAIAAAAIAIPSLLILYFLKLRRRDVEISTTLLWKKAIEDLQANAPFQKLRKNILLLLQLLALGAALTALGQPQIQGSSTVGSKHVILIDRSASMASLDAKDAGGRTVSRLDAAKEQALALIDSLREPGVFDRDGGDQAMVIAFDTAGKALQAFTSDKDQLRAAVRAITPSDAPTSIDEAYKLVMAQAPREVVVEVKEDGTESRYERPPKPIGTIHLFSDGRLPDADRVSPGRDDTVLFHAMGSPEAANVGIVSLQAKRAFDDPNKLSIFVGLDNTARQARTVQLECRIDDQIVGIKDVELPPATPPGAGSGGGSGSGPALHHTPGTNGTVFTMQRPQGGIVTVRAVPPEGDVLAVDNSAFLVIPPAKKLAVAVVTSANEFIADALRELPLSKLDVLTPSQFEASRATPGADYDVVILDGWLPPTPGGSPLPAGRWLILGAVPQAPDLLIDQGKGPPTVFLDWSRDHPALRGLSLDVVVIGSSRNVEIPAGSAAVAIARTNEGPGIVEFTTPEAHALVVPFDLVQTNWPFEVSFVLFMAQAIGHLGGDSSGLGQMLQPGGVLTDRIPPSARDVRVRLPGGETAVIGEPAPDGRIVYGPIQRTGVYLLSWEGPPGPTDAHDGRRSTRAFAANLLSSPESDVAAATTLSFASREVSASTESQAKAVKRLWPWLLLVCLGVVLFEWWVYNRKVQL